MAAYHHHHDAFVAVSTTTLLFLLCGSKFSLVSSSLTGGFTVDLIHRDSPRSPFYDPFLTPSQRLTNAVRRSHHRTHRFSPKTSSLSDQMGPNQAEATIIMNRGEYLMELSLGTPPVPIKAIADTGSDLIWTQCEPCTDCFKQEDPLFDPRNSSTYTPLSCSSSQCAALNGTCTEDEESTSCHYSVSYGDRSYSRGVYAKETLTLDSTTESTKLAFPKTLIGCGFENAGTFPEEVSGIVGLGGGNMSLIFQLDSSIDGKFSYCLVPIQSQTQTTSKLSFGNNAVVSGPQVVSTPISQGEGPYPDTFYFLTLEAISVEDIKIPFPPASTGEGNIIIDSGTTLTFVPEGFYSQLETEVAKLIGKERVDLQEFTPLCYRISGSGDDFEAPVLTLHFKGASVKLDTSRTFVRATEEAVCFTFSPSNSVSIYGNLGQMNLLVGYDRNEKTVSFKPTDCTKH